SRREDRARPLPGAELLPAFGQLPAGAEGSGRPDDQRLALDAHLPRRLRRPGACRPGLHGPHHRLAGRPHRLAARRRLPARVEPGQAAVANASPKLRLGEGRVRAGWDASATPDDSPRALAPSSGAVSPDEPALTLTLSPGLR